MQTSTEPQMGPGSLATAWRGRPCTRRGHNRTVQRACQGEHRNAPARSAGAHGIGSGEWRAVPYFAAYSLDEPDGLKVTEMGALVVAGE
jgi:hypothetical protein